MISIAGLYALKNAVNDFLGVETYPHLFEQVEDVLSGEKTFDEALSAIKVVNSSRYNFIEALKEFDLGLFLNVDIPFPDYDTLGEENFVIEQVVELRPLAIRAWEKLQDAEYIPGLFSMSVLIAIFLSSYPQYVVDKVDFDPVLEAYTMLKRGIIGKNLGEDYGNRHK